MALLAQWLERAAVNRKVTGSIPVGSGSFWSIISFILLFSVRVTFCMFFKVVLKIGEKN